MPLIHLILALTVVVGLSDGKQVSIENPKFNGFIETRDDGHGVLYYGQKAIHGEMPLENIQRIDIGYKRGKPYPLTITLKDGRKIEVESEHRDFLTVQGQSDQGSVLIKHPDPISPTAGLFARASNRKGSLTIRYIEFSKLQ